MQEAPIKAATMLAVQSSSRVIYPSAPNDPHTLEITLAEDGFARLKLASDPQVQGRRVLQHMSEGDLYVTSPRASQSLVLTAESAQETSQWFELRRQLYDWGQNDLWQAIPDHPDQRILPGRNKLSLKATLHPSTGLPKSMGFYDAGQLVQRFAKIEWPVTGPQMHPLAFQMETSAGIVWLESDIKIRRGLRMNADYFLPTDRRQPSSAPVTVRRASK